MENDGLPQQVCARCCAKLDFTCDFFEDCRSVQETFSIITSQNTEAAINQRNDIGIEDESENGNKDEVEIEADKENTVPVVTNSKNSRKVRRYSRQRSIKKHEKNITPLKEQIRNIVTTNGLNKDSNTARPSCKSQVIIVKQEDINGEKASSQSRKPVETSSKSDDLVRIPIEKSNDSSMYQEKKAPCVNVTSDNQVESKVNDESDSTLAQTTNINLMNGFSLAETDNITKTAVALPVQSDFLVLEKSHQEAQTNMQDGSSCVSGKDKSGKRNSIKISQLMTEEEKRLVETSYKINLSLMKCEVQNKMTVLNKDNIKCNICGANYSRSDKCRVHIMNHLEIKPYECVKCDYSTVTISNIRAHIRKCHLKIKPYACDQCDKRYGSMILLQEHINSHTGVRPFKCEICDFTYMSRQGLNCHYKTHKLNKDIKCDICPKMFKSTARKNAHMLVHNKENMIQCLICKNYLSSETNLHTHMKKVHSQKYVCDICNKEMLSRKNLYNHKNVHMKAKYKCMLCFKFYKNKHILKEHMLKHEGIRKYKCNDCDKTFAQQSHLAAHSATHSDVRFPCAGCGKQFNRRDNMKMHTKRCQLFLHQSVSTFVPKIRDKLVNIQNENNMTR
ncbi:zinc finger protein 660-like isoform X2 [Odontomachus brunneus]|nr:zinc finger protein 660-like isoform X2 [Odontomachus brunneus]